MPVASTRHVPAPCIPRTHWNTPLKQTYYYAGSTGTSMQPVTASVTLALSVCTQEPEIEHGVLQTVVPTAPLGPKGACAL